MKSVNADVLEYRKASRSALIRIEVDDAGRRTWKKWDDKLQLAADHGFWVVRPLQSTQWNLLFLDSSGNQFASVMLFGGLPPHFLDVFWAKTLTGTGFLSDDDMTEITWLLWGGRS
jgi:hypothetical protein